MNQAYQNMRDQSIRRVRETTFAAAFRSAITSAYGLLDKFESEHSAIASDRNLSDLGRRDKMAKLVADRYAKPLSDLSDDARRSREYSQAQRRALGATNFDRTDAAGAIERREVRDVVRSQPDATRFPFAVDLARRDKSAAEALLSGPSHSLMGLSQRQFDELKSTYVASHFGPQLAEIDGLAGDAAEVAAAVTLVRDQIRRVSGLPDDVLTPAKAQAA